MSAPDDDEGLRLLAQMEANAKHIAALLREQLSLACGLPLDILTEVIVVVRAAETYLGQVSARRESFDRSLKQAEFDALIARGEFVEIDSERLGVRGSISRQEYEVALQNYIRMFGLSSDHTIPPGALLRISSVNQFLGHPPKTYRTCACDE